MTTVGMVATGIAALVVAVTGFTTSAAEPPSCTPGTDVTIASGPVCGVTANGMDSYLGIPFAAPPVGPLRWHSPQPVAPWTDTLHATTPGNICVAPVATGGMIGNEDCLNLNVQAPAGHSGHLPVMVEIHGGGFLSTAFNALNDGVNLVTRGNVVYVAINYRLGILGFMANKGLGPNSGDYGLQDQQAALRWIQRNIAKFGGDPHNVTIFGQSAGRASVCAQTASPTARGLFNRGISQSGFYNSGVGPNEVWEAADCKSQLPTEAQAEQAGAAYATKVGCGATDVACLRALPVATLVANAGQPANPNNNGGTIAPTINGTTLPMSPAKAFATGHVNPVGIMIGASRDEINGGNSSAPFTAATPDQYTAQIQHKYGKYAAAVLARYPLDRFESPYVAFRTVVADADSVCPAVTGFQNLSRHIPTFAYEEDDSDTPNTYLSPTNPNGAFHVAEGGYVLPRAPLNVDADQQVLADQVTFEWLGYATHANPTAAHTPLWTAFSHHNQSVMSLVPAGDSALVPADVINAQHHCDFWDAITQLPQQ